MLVNPGTKVALKDRLISGSLMNAGMADWQKMSVKPRAYTSWPQIREMLPLRTHWLVSM